MVAASAGRLEDVTREIQRHIESCGLVNPVILQCDQEMSVVGVCRNIARKKKARTLPRFAPKTSHQRNGFVEAAHGHIQRLARCYQTQIETKIETNTGSQLSATSPAVPFAVRYSGFVPTSFTVRPNGRTPFQYLSGAPYATALCVFGESILV